MKRYIIDKEYTQTYMHVYEALGAIGIGLVCGWLMNMALEGKKRLIRNSIWLILAIIPIAVWIFFITDWRTVVLFIVSTVLALLCRHYWIQQLRYSSANNISEQGG
jgi:hypothetical protein